MPERTPSIHRPWTVLQEREICARAPYLQVVEQTVLTGNGARIEDFYQVRLRDFGLVVPVLADGRVQLIRQYKHGPGTVSLGFPAGFLDRGEMPQDGAVRELREETGLAPGRIQSLGAFVDNGNQRGCEGHYFLAQDCAKVAEPAPGDLEAFEYVTHTPAEVDRAMAEGAFAIIHHVAAWGLARPLIG